MVLGGIKSLMGWNRMNVLLSSKVTESFGFGYKFGVNKLQVIIWCEPLLFSKTVANISLFYCSIIVISLSLLMALPVFSSYFVEISSKVFLLKRLTSCISVFIVCTIIKLFVDFTL